MIAPREIEGPSNGEDEGCAPSIPSVPQARAGSISRSNERRRRSPSPEFEFDQWLRSEVDSELRSEVEPEYNSPSEVSAQAIYVIEDASFQCMEPCELQTILLNTPAGGSNYVLMTHLMERGPSTLEELGRHTQAILEHTIHGQDGEVRRCRLANLFERGVALHTDFSGRQGAEMCLLMVEAEMARLPGFHMPPGWVRLWRASEPCIVLKQAMRQHDSTARPQHLLTTVESAHLDPDDILAIEAKRPPDLVSHEDRVQWHRTFFGGVEAKGGE